MDKLGIYIPTFNRKEELKNCLESFIPQLKPHNIPIFISDNNSVDGTDEMINKMQKEYGKIFYKKNDTELGNFYAANLISVLRMGTSEFVWFFGDDDVVVEDAIRRILKGLENNEFIQINTEVWDNNFKNKLETRKIDTTTDLDYPAGEFYGALLNSNKDYAGFMSQIITKRKYLIKQLEGMDLNDVSNLDFLHLSLVFNSIVNKKGKLIAAPLIRYRAFNSRPGKRNFEMWIVNYCNALESLKQHYSPSLLRANYNLPKRVLISITTIYMVKYYDADKIKYYKKHIKNNELLSYSNRLLLLLILNTPKVMLFVLYTIARKIKKFRELEK